MCRPFLLRLADVRDETLFVYPPGHKKPSTASLDL